MVAALALFPLAGCGVYDNVSLLWSDPVVLSCPDYRVVADAAELVKFRDGPGRDLIDVDFEGAIVDVQLGCVTDVDRRTRRGTMEVEVTVSFDARRGPANRDRKARFPYFVSVVDRDRTILYREEFAITIDFPGNKTRLVFRNEPITLELPILRNRSSRDYSIFAGFKLTRGQLRFNRERRAGAKPG